MGLKGFSMFKYKGELLIPKATIFFKRSKGFLSLTAG
jgi:hypothetical protein